MELSTTMPGKQKKHPRAAKPFSCLLLLAGWLLFACPGRAQDIITTRISLQVAQQPLSAVFKEIEKQTGLMIEYQHNVVNKDKLVSIRVKEASVQKILQQLFTGMELRFMQQGKSILVVKDIQPAPPAKKNAIEKQPGKVTGKIVDEENGEGVAGATVRIGSEGVTTGTDGVFVISLSQGSYTATISHVAYGVKEVTDVDIRDNQIFELNVTLKREKGHLAGVAVKSSAKKESVAALYTQQKNAAVLSDGISAQQISATPDKHVGETLKRITGVSTQDNSRVVVRGIAERYNVSLINGSPLPSTDVQERDFEFDLIPTNLVESIVVAKSATADMPYGFAGGMVQINTKSVPTQNFTTFSAGTSTNSRTTGKDFLGYKRGKYDYLGFDDGNRNHVPDQLYGLLDKFNPANDDQNNVIKAAQVAEQNKRIGGTERLGTRAYQAAPSQNYQVTMGRVYKLGNNTGNNFGFVASLGYRNTQQNTTITSIHRGLWSRIPSVLNVPELENTGNQFLFNTTWGAMLNGGFRFRNHQINIHNLYTHIYDNRFTRIKGFTDENPTAAFPNIQEDDRPKFSNLLQNKLSGISVFDRVKLEWSIARTSLNTEEKDASYALLNFTEYGNKAPLFTYMPSNASDPGFGNINRGKFTYKEYNYEAMVSAAYTFKLGKSTHTFKTGYNYLGKHAWYSWAILPIGTGDFFSTSYGQIPLQEWGNYMSMTNPKKDLYYNPSVYSLNGFEAKSKNMGTFAMFDQRPLTNLRIIWGVRADYFKLDTIRNAASRQDDEKSKMIMKENKDWYFLPSAAITYTPVNNLNVRTAYSKTAVRPGLMENSRFSRYNPAYGTVITSSGVNSTLIDNYDVKLEWFPGAGEIISAGYFYKYFDKPAEYYRRNDISGGRPYVTITNSEWAKVKGWEFEIRKNLGFVKTGLLSDIFFSGNLTLQQSKVKAREAGSKTAVDGSDSLYYTYMKFSRALYGQVPLIFNTGLQYAGKRLGLNLVYNYMGYKTFFTSNTPDLAEYERPRGQFDAQVSYTFLKNKLEAKLNVSNLTDAPYRFFINGATEYQPGMDKIENRPADAEWGDLFRYKDGYSDKYEAAKTKNGVTEGDRTTLIQYVGRTFSFTLTYHL